MEASPSFIPVNVPLLEDREKELLMACIDTGWISSEGEFVRTFERGFAEFIGVKHGVSVCNGTAALDLAVAALGLEPGDEVIVPTFTIISCILAIIRNGLKPVLVDAEKETWNMAVGQIQDKITSRTRAIMPVHIYGHPVDMAPLIDIARKHDLSIIEDAAEAHGAEYRDKKCGSLGDLSVFSFYANKIITTGEGGMVMTNADVLAERLRKLRNLAFEPGKRFVHYQAGWNYRMGNLQAAIGMAQMERIDRLLERKRMHGLLYRALLGRIKGITLQTLKTWANPVFWVNGIVLNDDIPMDAQALAGKLLEKGVQTRPFFWPMHEQPVFHQKGLFKEERHPVSERLARRGVYLPSGMALTEDQIHLVCHAVSDCLK